MDGYLTRRAALGAVGAVAMFPPLAAGVNATASRAPAPVLEIRMRLGVPQAGAHGWRHAVVQAGLVTGSVMQGAVRSGQLQWLVDPASGAVEVVMNLQVVRADGTLIQVRDRTTHMGMEIPTEHPGLPTAPELFDSAGRALQLPAPLAGRLDAAQLRHGAVWLRAFDLG